MIHFIGWVRWFSSMAEIKPPQLFKLCQLPDWHLTLISTWLKVLPLYTPTIDPTISGRMIMSLRWVFTTSGFSMGGASFFALRRRLRRVCCLRRRPRFSLLLWRAQYSCISCSLEAGHRGKQFKSSFTPPIPRCKRRNHVSIHKLFNAVRHIKVKKKKKWLPILDK